MASSAKQRRRLGRLRELGRRLGRRIARAVIEQPHIQIRELPALVEDVDFSVDYDPKGNGVPANPERWASTRLDGPDVSILHDTLVGERESDMQVEVMTVQYRDRPQLAIRFVNGKPKKIISYGARWASCENPLLSWEEQECLRRFVLVINQHILVADVFQNAHDDVVSA